MNGTEIIKAEVLEKPGNGFQSRNEIYTIARRLMSHTSGKIIGGYGTAPNGDILPLQGTADPGDLALQDALYAVEYALTRGLNPYGLHIWYQRSKKHPTPQLIIEIDWKIMKGWAEWRSPFKTEYIQMDSDARQKYGLAQGDLGALAYNILDADNAYFHQYQLTFIQQGIVPREARSLATRATAKSVGVGIVLAYEMKSSNGKAIAPPKGRSWQWRAETRAFRDATRRSHGEPPPAQIRAFAAAGKDIAINENHLGLLASKSYPADLDADGQRRYLQLGAQAEAIKTGDGGLSTQDLQIANDLMNRNGDDDPLDLSPEEIGAAVPLSDESPESNPPPQDLVDLRQAIQTEATGNPRQGLATEKQTGLVTAKLEEVFAADDGERKARAVIIWLCQIEGVQEMKFGHAQALLKRLILAKDDETGDYPLNRTFAKSVQAIYRQTQIEQGQMEV